MCRSIACLLLSLISVAALADDNALGLSYVDTPDVSVIYFDSLGYLVPHSVRTFTNSLVWQRNMFDWTPNEADDCAAAGSSRTTATRHLPRSPRDTLFLRHRAAVARVRDISRERAHVLR